MSRGAWILTSALFVLAASGPGLEAQEGESAQMSSVHDGVYSEEQAERGEDTYDAVCAYCHTTSQFTGASFLRAWSGASLSQFFGLVMGTMPYDAPGSLSQQEYADVVAYILSLNDLPTGEQELPGDMGELREIEIRPASDSGEAGS